MPGKPSLYSKKIKVERQPDNFQTYDLDQLNVLNLVKELQANLSEKRPKSAFFKWWGNKKHALDAEQQGWILTQLNSAIAISDSVNTLKAKAILSPEIVTDMINGYRVEAQRKAEMALETHLTEVYKQQAEREALDRVRRREEAEIRLIEQKTEIVEYIKQNINIDDLRPHHKTLLIQAMLGGQQYVDLETLEEIRKYAVMEAEGKARQVIGTAKQTEAQARIADMDAKAAEDTYDLVRKPKKGR